MAAVVGKKNSKAEFVGFRECARNGEEGEGVTGVAVELKTVSSSTLN